MSKVHYGLKQGKRTRDVNKTYENKRDPFNKIRFGDFFNMNMSPLVLYSSRDCPLINNRLHCLSLLLDLLALMSAFLGV